MSYRDRERGGYNNNNNSSSSSSSRYGRESDNSHGSYDSFSSRGGYNRGGGSSHDEYSRGRGRSSRGERPSRGGSSQNNYYQESSSRNAFQSNSCWEQSEKPPPLLSLPVPKDGSYRNEFGDSGRSNRNQNYERDSSPYQRNNYEEEASYSTRGARGGSRGRGRGHNSNPTDILDALGPDAKFALTKALFASVLNNESESFPQRHNERENENYDFQEPDRGRPSFSAPRGRSRGRGWGPRGGGPPSGPRGGGGRGMHYQSSEDNNAPIKRMRMDSDHELQGGPPSKKEVWQSPPIGYVELVCPHCPHMRSLRFKMYKDHIASPEHMAIVQGLTRKHSDVKFKLREEQRRRLKVSLANWSRINQKTFSQSVNRYCKGCKFNFKLKAHKIKHGIDKHNASKLHKIQEEYLLPVCQICKLHFENRMYYEQHRASIEHLKKKCFKIQEFKNEGKEVDLEDSDLDPDEFIRSLNGDVDDTDYDTDSGENKKDDNENEDKKQDRGWKRGYKETEDEDEDEDSDEYKYSSEKNREPLGTDYVQQIDAFFCQLCSKVIRADTGDTPDDILVDHCRSGQHIEKYRDLHPPEEEFVFPADDEMQLDYDEESHNVVKETKPKSILKNSSEDNGTKSKRIPKLRGPNTNGQ